MTITYDFLKRLPKTDLHCHLDGSLRIETFMELARKQGIVLPANEASALKRTMGFGRIHENLVEYIGTFDLVCASMRSKEAIERVAFELVADAASENVWVIEPRFYPKFLMRDGLTIEDVVEAAILGVKKAEKRFGVAANLILCGLKHMPEEDNWDVVKTAERFRDHGVVAFDLAGPEAGFPTKNYAKLCHFALDHGLGLTVHAGEAFGPASIAQAIDDCKAQRIGHGTTLVEDTKLLSKVSSQKIPIEVCLSSNIHTKAVANFSEHPVRKYLDAGVMVSFSTDNRLMSLTDVTNELWLSHEHLDFSKDDIIACVRNGFASAFLPKEQKTKILLRLDEELKNVA